MNQPTEDRIKRLEEVQRQLKEEIRQLREQRTEEIKVTRIEVASEDVVKHLDSLEQGQQEISQKQDEHFKHIKEEFTSTSKRHDEHAKGLFTHSKHIGALQEEMRGARADIANIQATQSDHGELLKNVTTKEDLNALKNVHGQKLDEHGQKLDEHSRKLDEQHDMLRQILRLLGQKPPES
ncbi:MAG TPA: hypothetical protein VN207_12120 [Ktedonobacteraceae bacterium]|nr:hypothetical protein [Ktedonobacteraceae bacterium]